MLAAWMLITASVAFAGDSPALKAIMKAKTYAEAESLVQSSLSQLANDAEKAKAYNKIVDLAVDYFTVQHSTKSTNEALGKEGGVDEDAMFQALAAAFDAAAACDKYDQKPNEKGKVAPKFQTKNADRLYNLRPQLINGGVFFQGKNDNKNAFKFLASYVDTHDFPLFSKFAATPDENLGNISYYAAVYAYQARDWQKAEQYIKYALKDKKMASDAQTLQMAILQAQLENHADSVAYCQKLLDIYNGDKNNEAIFGSLVTMYEALGEKDKMVNIINDKLAATPNSYAALALLGSVQKNDGKYDEAAETLKKSLQFAEKDRQALVYTLIGDCYFDKAQEKVNNYKGALPPTTKAVFAEVFQTAIGYYEKARELDPKNETRWAYHLYSCCNFCFGPDDAKTQQAKADAGM